MSMMVRKHLVQTLNLVRSIRIQLLSRCTTFKQTNYGSVSSGTILTTISRELRPMDATTPHHPLLYQRQHQLSYQLYFLQYHRHCHLLPLILPKPHQFFPLRRQQNRPLQTTHLLIHLYHQLCLRPSFLLKPSHHLYSPLGLRHSLLLKPSHRLQFHLGPQASRQQ